MKSLIKEQMAEINDLQSENEALKRMLEEQKNAVASEVPEAMVAKYIAVNKDALQEDIREARGRDTNPRRARRARNLHRRDLVVHVGRQIYPLPHLRRREALARVALAPDTFLPRAAVLECRQLAGTRVVLMRS